MQKMYPASVIIEKYSDTGRKVSLVIVTADYFTVRFMEDEENAGKYCYNDSDSWLLWIPDL